MLSLTDSWIAYLPILGALVVSFWIALSLYRVYISPLSKFPGPKLAAATSWYEGYFNVIQEGVFFKKIQDLHKKYG